MIEPGIYESLTSDEYHGDKASISRSALMDFKKSPRNYWAKHLNPDRPLKNATPAMEFGTAFHTLILEPHLFDAQYFVLPEKVLLKNVGREKYDEYKSIEKEAEETKKTVLSRSDYLKLQAMRTNLIANERAIALIQGAVYESSYFWEDEHTGLIVKSRPDILHANMYVDLKTCADASPHAFQKAMASGGYHIQAAMVFDGVHKLESRRLSACINICVETDYPHSIGIYIIDESALNVGHSEYKNLLLQLKSAIVHNEFEDYQIETISLPAWYK